MDGVLKIFYEKNGDNMDNNWIIESNSLEDKDLLKYESIFNVANGYVGVRGNFEEGYSNDKPTVKGTFINAFYDIVPLTYGEKAFAFPDTMEKLVNVIDSQTINLIIDGEKFSLFEGQIKSYKRYLNMKRGYYRREIHWISPLSKEIKLVITRITSFTNLELFAINYEIEKVNFKDEVTIESIVDGDVRNYTNDSDPRTGSGQSKLLIPYSISFGNDIMQVSCKTKTSNETVATTTKHISNVKFTSNYYKTEKSIKGVFTFESGTRKINFTKYNIYTDSRRYKDPLNDGKELIRKLSNKSFETILEEQEEYLEKFWRVSDILIKGDESLQQGLRFNLYQLLQSVGKDSISNIAAKGLSGEGYEGHYFWDSEVYMLPFFTLCNPKLAKNLLKYRYTILDSARKRALELGHTKGAAYAWRTIAGSESSAYFPAGTAQYHINSDIAYSYIQYFLVTNDIEFIKEFGAEVVIETARIWMEIGHYHDDKFKIDAVTGPDEYSAIVNNNYFTNAMAKYNLQWATKLYYLLLEIDPTTLNMLSKKINITKEEVDLWNKACTNMYLPYDDKYKINAQDDSFLSKAVWDFKNTPKDKYPLLLHYHPLTIYRYQVLKQADTVLSHFLLEDESDMETIKNSYDYYEKITTHDSSLSCAIYSIMACKIGYYPKAYDYFIETARLDLEDTHSNTKDGIHTANMGGTWMCIVFGFAGLRIKKDMLSFKPRLPEKWEELNFKIQYKNSIINVNLNKNRTLISIEGSNTIKIKVDDELYELNENNKNWEQALIPM